MKDLNLDLALYMGELADQLVTVQYYLGGGGSSYATVPTVPRLYEASRKVAGEPLSYAAAKGLIDAVRRDDYVVVSTGFVVPPVMVPEGDGPIGAVGLARALALAFDAKVILLTEDCNLDWTDQLMRAAGLATTRDAEAQHRNRVLLHGFPIDDTEARTAARTFMETYRPKAIVTLEKPSRNADGRYRNGAGIDMTDAVAKIDYLFDLAAEFGTFTIGIGDGGNEIGMGNIADVVSEVIPTARGANGVGAATGADVCMVASIANWGGYAIEAVLAAALNNSHILHSGEVEARVLDAAARIGFVDPTTCTADGHVDGVPPMVSQHIIEHLHVMLDVRTRKPGRADIFKELMSDKAALQRAVDTWNGRLS